MPEPEDTVDAPAGGDAPTGPSDLMDKVVGLCKRRGFIFQSAEIYGGFRSTYDYGPLGVNLLRNVKNAWWDAMVQRRDDVVGLDAAILSPPAVWEASGHLANFSDPLVDCRNCHQRWREDKIGGVCPACGSTRFTEARAFNLMFKTHAGPIEDEGAVAYLRPETAQGMFINSPTCSRPRARGHPSGSPRWASRSATRSPRRTSASGPVSSSRWRWSTSSRPPRPSTGSSTGWTSGTAGISGWASPSRSSGCATTTPTSCPTTRRVPRTWSSSSRGDGTSSRASPTGPTSTSRPTQRRRGSGSSTSTRPPVSATCPTSSSPPPGPPAP